MADEQRFSSGYGARGQVTTERVGGHDAEVSQPRELTWDRMKRRAMEALFALVGVPLLLGPWSLVVYVPLYLERALYAVADWFDIEAHVDRLSMACLGALVFVALIVAPDAAMVWWPFAWQRSAVTVRGLLWPAFWPRVVPVVLLIGGILWFRVATQRQVVQRLPNDVPVLISRRIYDPRSALNAALDAPHPANLDHAMALAVQRPRYVPVDLIPRNPVLEVDYGE